MDGYLLDTSVVSNLLNKNKPLHAATVQRVNELPDEAIKYVSVITLGELAFGIELAQNRGHPRLSDAKHCLNQAKTYPILEVSKHTADEYARIKESLARRHYKKQIPKHVDQWNDIFTSQQLGIGENDLWISALAAERNLILITNDTGFTRIQECFSGALRISVVSTNSDLS